MNLCKFSWNIVLLEKNIAFESENIFEIKIWLKNNEKWIIFDSFVSNSDFVLDWWVEVLNIKNFLKNEFFAFFSQNSDKKFILHSIKTPEIYQKSKLPICEWWKFDEIKNLDKENILDFAKIFDTENKISNNMTQFTPICHYKGEISDIKYFHSNNKILSLISLKSENNENSTIITDFDYPKCELCVGWISHSNADDLFIWNQIIAEMIDYGDKYRSNYFQIYSQENKSKSELPICNSSYYKQDFLQDVYHCLNYWYCNFNSIIIFIILFIIIIWILFFPIRFLFKKFFQKIKN